MKGAERGSAKQLALHLLNETDNDHLESMTAKNLSHYKRKLQDVSRELYLEHEWTTPRCLMKRQQQNRCYY